MTDLIQSENLEQNFISISGEKILSNTEIGANGLKIIST